MFQSAPMLRHQHVDANSDNNTFIIVDKTSLKFEQNITSMCVTFFTKQLMIIESTDNKKFSTMSLQHPIVAHPSLIMFKLINIFVDLQ